MANTTYLHLVNNMFDHIPPTGLNGDNKQYDFFIDPKRITRSNATISKTGVGWNSWDNGITVGYGVPGSVDTYTYTHAWGLTYHGPGTTSSTGTLTFLFKGAVHRPSDPSKQYDLKIEFIDPWVYSQSGVERNIVLVSLSDDTDSIPEHLKGFWVQCYLNYIDNRSFYGCSAGVTVQLTIQDAAGNAQLGTFPYPFTDLDMVTDDYTKYWLHADDEQYEVQIGDNYVEQIQLGQNCVADVYALTDSQLAVDQQQGAQANRQLLTNIVAQYHNHYDLGPLCRFYNGFYQDAPGEGYIVGLVARFNKATSTTNCRVIWRGSQCGTSLRGEGMGHAIRYHENLPSGAPPGNVSNMPNDEYKYTNVAIRLSTTVPKFNPSGGNSLIFLGWATTPTGSVEYSPGSELTSDTIYDLYAKWQVAYRVTFVSNGGYGINNYASPPIEGPNSSWTYYVPPHGSIKMCGDNSKGWRFEKPGCYTMGWASSSTATDAPYQPDFVFNDITAPATYYAIYQTMSHNVQFHDGYSASDDVIYTTNIKDGSNVPADAVPQPKSRQYPDFYKPGFYRFESWAGDITNIKCNVNALAVWEFVPIWVMRNGEWIKYDPE